MLIRHHNKSIMVISQPAHSWLAGQLARAWGNHLFGRVEPREEVVLAATLHDLGFFAWEQSPTLNRHTGWPYTFMELPTALHLDIWSRGIQQMLVVNHYAALLVSMHYAGLAERHPAADSAEARAAQQKFLIDQRAFQGALLQALHHDARYAAYCQPPILNRNRDLIAIWDWMSLVFGLAKEKRVDIPEVPAEAGQLKLRLTLQQDQSEDIHVSPWPFTPPSLHLRLEGRRLEGKFSDETQLQEALRSAPVEMVRLELLPG